jgi:hypothetical protein
MSDNWLQFVPCDPEYQPSPQAAERACLLLLGFAAQAAVVSADFTESVQFFHRYPGAAAFGRFVLEAMKIFHRPQRSSSVGARLRFARSTS